MFSFVRRLPLPRGDEGPPQVGGQALDKAEQKLRETHNNNAGQAAVAGFARRCDQSGRHLISIPPRPDDRYPDWVTGDRLWPRLCKNSGWQRSGTADIRVKIGLSG